MRDVMHVIISYLPTIQRQPSNHHKDQPQVFHFTTSLSLCVSNVLDLLMFLAFLVFLSKVLRVPSSAFIYGLGLHDTSM